MITTLYLTLALILTTTIYLKTQKISNLSTHQGIQLINKSFLFLSIAYLLQILITTSTLPFSKLAIFNALTNPVATYLFTISALYLSTSLFWKNQTKDSTPLHSLAILITILNNFTNILPLVLTAIYTFTAFKAYENYTFKKTIFSQSLLIAIALLALASLSSIFYNLSSSYAMNLTAFSIFLYGTLKTMKK